MKGLDPGALRELYEKYAPLVRVRAKQLLGREADAWDAVQEVFRAVLERGAAFRGEARPMTYLYRITTNVCIDALRSRAVRERARGEPREEKLDGEGQAEAHQFLLRLSERLDRRQLQIAVLHFVDGLSQEEIGEVVKLSRKTVGLELQHVRAAAASLAAPEAEHG